MAQQPQELINNDLPLTEVALDADKTSRTSDSEDSTSDIQIEPEPLPEPPNVRVDSDSSDSQNADDDKDRSHPTQLVLQNSKGKGKGKEKASKTSASKSSESSDDLSDEIVDEADNDMDQVDLEDQNLPSPVPSFNPALVQKLPVSATTLATVFNYYITRDKSLTTAQKLNGLFAGLMGGACLTSHALMINFHSPTLVNDILFHSGESLFEFGAHAYMASENYSAFTNSLPDNIAETLYLGGRPQLTRVKVGDGLRKGALLIVSAGLGVPFYFFMNMGVASNVITALMAANTTFYVTNSLIPMCFRELTLRFPIGEVQRARADIQFAIQQAVANSINDTLENGVHPSWGDIAVAAQTRLSEYARSLNNTNFKPIARTNAAFIAKLSITSLTSLFVIGAASIPYFMATERKAEHITHNTNLAILGAIAVLGGSTIAATYYSASFLQSVIDFFNGVRPLAYKMSKAATIPSMLLGAAVAGLTAFYINAGYIDKNALLHTNLHIPLEALITAAITAALLPNIYGNVLGILKVLENILVAVKSDKRFKIARDLRDFSLMLPEMSPELLVQGLRDMQAQTNGDANLASFVPINGPLNSRVADIQTKMDTISPAPNLGTPSKGTKNSAVSSLRTFNNLPLDEQEMSVRKNGDDTSIIIDEDNFQDPMADTGDDSAPLLSAEPVSSQWGVTSAIGECFRGLFSRSKPPAIPLFAGVGVQPDSDNIGNAYIPTSATPPSMTSSSSTDL